MGYVQEIRKKIGHDPLMIVGGGVFVCRDGEVLLQRRRDNGLWSLHGGSLEIGETIEQTARRELTEETGLVANDLTLLGVFSGPDMAYTYPNGDAAYIVTVAFLCEDFSGTPLPETDETLELRWFPVDALPQDVSPADRVPFRAFAAWAAERY